MNSIKESVSDIVVLAKNGDLGAKNKLFEMNMDIVIRIATEAYYEIVKIYKVNQNDKIPNNIITMDDVVQDFSIKANDIFNNFLNNSDDMFFSTYLIIRLNSYAKTYIKRETQSLIERVDMECMRNLDLSFYNYLDMSEDSRKREYIMDILKKDFTLSHYEEFIKLVFLGYDYERLKELTKLDGRKINIKLNLFIKHFLDKKEKLEEKEKHLELLKKAKNGDTEAINMMCEYYDDFILHYSNKAYNQIILNEFLISEITLETVYDVFQKYFYKCLNRYIDKNYQTEFREYMLHMYNSYVRYYVKKILKKHGLLEKNKVKIKNQEFK